MPRTIRPKTVPIVAGIQNFDQTIVPYQFDSDTTTTAGHDYISTSLREEAGPGMVNMMIWSDNAKQAYATQRPALKLVEDLSTSAGNDFQAKVDEDSPVGYWRMSDRADTTGVSSETNTGSVGGTAIYNATTTLPITVQGLVLGDHDTAKTFGTDNTARLVHATNASFNNTSGGFTVSAIITPTADDVDANVHIIVCKGTTHINEWCLFLENGLLKFRNATGGVETAGATTLLAGTTYLVSAVHESDDDLVVYVNGVSDGTGSNATRTSGTTDVGIGNDAAGTSTEDFNGVIDEVAIFATGLTSTQLLDHNTAITAGTFPAGNVIGRGVYRAQATSNEYAAIGGRIAAVPRLISGLPYKAGVLSTTTVKIPDGGGKVYMDEIDTGEVVVLIPEDDLEAGSQGHLITTDGTNCYEVTNHLPPSIVLAKGVVFLNGRAYVMDTIGNIYNSAEGDLTSWSALEFINAEREFDGGKQLVKHHDHIVAFGERTIEFFFDDANATASPLDRRTDIFYRYGIVGTASRVGDVIYFIGIEEGNDFGLYRMQQFQIERVSDERVDAKIATMVLGARDNYLTTCAFSINSRHFVSIVQVNATETNTPTYAYNLKDHLLYDVKYGALYDWSSGNSSLNPTIIDYGVSGSFVTQQGTLVRMLVELATTVEDDPAAGADTDGIPASPQSISWSITSPNFIFGNNRYKFWKNLDLEGTFGKRQSGADPVDIDISWSDDYYETFNTPKTIDFSEYKFLERAMGRSRQRAFKLTSTTKARVFLQHWVIRCLEGTH